MNLPTEKLKKLGRKYKIQLMVVFGSYLTEQFTAESDLDLAIQTTDAELIKEHKLDILAEISKLCDHREIDLILLNQADPLLKFQVAREGKLVYETETGLFNSFKVQAMNEHQDAQKFYQLDKKFIDNYLEGKQDGQQRVSPPQIN